MVKYFLNTTKQEVKIGDKVSITVPTSTPYGQAKCSIDVVVTQATLEQLIKDGLVSSREQNIIALEDYKPFVRRLARKHNTSFTDALGLLDDVKKVSMYAHNELLLEMIAEVYNNGKSTHNRVYVIDNATAAIRCTEYSQVCTPYFVSMDDAIKAAQLMRPFYEEARKRK